MQMTTPHAVIVRRTGIAEARLWEFAMGAEPTADEIEVLAALWYVKPDGLAESILQASCPKVRRFPA